AQLLTTRFPDLARTQPEWLERHYAGAGQSTVAADAKPENLHPQTGFSPHDVAIMAPTTLTRGHEEICRMDFEVTYTPEQEAFRTEVRAWLAANIPDGLEQPIDPGHLSLEQYQNLRELGRRLGAKGWLYPTYPKEYGGGELSVDFVMILEEELDRYGLHLPPYYDSGGRLGGASI